MINSQKKSLNKHILFDSRLLKSYGSIRFFNRLNSPELNSIWCCKDCKTNFIFRSDVQDHIESTGHLYVDEYDMESGRYLNTIAK
jgi:hypothetical protein